MSSSLNDGLRRDWARLQLLHEFGDRLGRDSPAGADPHRHQLSGANQFVDLGPADRQKLGGLLRPR